MALNVKVIKSIFSQPSGEIKADKNISYVPVFPLWNHIWTKTYTEGFTLDTSITPDFITMTSPEIDEPFEIVGLVIEVAIYNRSGADDLYDWELTNETKAITYNSKTNHSIVSKGRDTWITLIGRDKFDPTDSINFNITNGVVGTAAGQASNGSITFNMRYMVRAVDLAEWAESKEI